MAKRTKLQDQDREICIPSVDDDACTLYFERNDHVTGQLSFFTTFEFDGMEASVRISKEGAQQLRNWLSEQLAR